MHPSLTISVSLSLRLYKPYKASIVRKHHSPERRLSVSHLFLNRYSRKRPAFLPASALPASVPSQVSRHRCPSQVSCRKCPIASAPSQVPRRKCPVASALSQASCWESSAGRGLQAFRVDAREHHRDVRAVAHRALRQADHLSHTAERGDGLRNRARPAAHLL